MRVSRNLRSKRGFTLVELLVVIGIIALLISILMPALRKARIAATNTVCASRLHQIAQACHIYMAEYKRFPVNYVNDPLYGSMIYPHDQQSRTLNELSTMLNFPEITDATPLSALPPVIQCPWAEQSDADEPSRKIVGNSRTYWYTGYAYYAGLKDNPNHTTKNPNAGYTNTQGIVLKPERLADGRGKHRGALWADALVYFGYNDMWYYTHVTPSTIKVANGFGFWRANTKPFAGRHQAWSDGSVEWTNGSDYDVAPGSVAQTASYYDGGQYYWWF